MSKDVHEELDRIFRQLHPFAPHEDGQRLAYVVGFVSPSDDFKKALEWRALVELYRLEHVQHCDCRLCRRFDALVGKKTNPQQTLPLEAA